MVRFSLLIALSIALVSCKKADGPSLPVSIELRFADSVTQLDSKYLESKKLKVKPNRAKDPNSNADVVFQTVDFQKVIQAFKNDHSIEDTFQTATITSTDGYRIDVKIDRLTDPNTLFVVDTPEIDDKRIYNEALKEHFDWRPGYIVFPERRESPASPYQVRQIEFSGTPKQHPVLSRVPKEHLLGAKIFVNTCNKCHSLFGTGGAKAPRITALLPRHPNNRGLKKFLTKPSETLGRKIGMSAFQGSNQELDALVLFLRTLPQIAPSATTKN